MMHGYSTDTDDLRWYGNSVHGSTASSQRRSRQHSRRVTDSQEDKTMAFTMDNRPKSLSKFKRTESLEFRLIFAAAFAVFLVAATVERLLPLGWFKRGQSRKSIIEQAKEAANTCAAYAFMG